MASGQRIYSAAYIMPPAGRAIDGAKHRTHLRLLEWMMRDNLPDRITAASTMEAGFSLLRSYIGIGHFLAYQYITDLNYSEVTDFSEMEFVMPGPGAIDGIRKCFVELGDYSASDLISWVADRQEDEFERRDLEFRSLWGRRLHLIDCQNLFCEISKYARVAYPGVEGSSGRTRIKQKYRSSGGPIEYWYPPKWRINALIGGAQDHINMLSAQRI